MSEENKVENWNKLFSLVEKKEIPKWLKGLVTSWWFAEGLSKTTVEHLVKNEDGIVVAHQLGFLITEDNLAELGYTGTMEEAARQLYELLEECEMPFEITVEYLGENHYRMRILRVEEDKNKKTYICPHCGADLFEVGIEEISIGRGRREIVFDIEEEKKVTCYFYDILPSEEWIECGACRKRIEGVKAADLINLYQPDFIDNEYGED